MIERPHPLGHPYAVALHLRVNQTVGGQCPQIDVSIGGVSVTPSRGIRFLAILPPTVWFTLVAIELKLLLSHGN